MSGELQFGQTPCSCGKSWWAKLDNIELHSGTPLEVLVYGDRWVRATWSFPPVLHTMPTLALSPTANCGLVIVWQPHVQVRWPPGLVGADEPNAWWSTAIALYDNQAYLTTCRTCGHSQTTDVHPGATSSMCLHCAFRTTQRVAMQRAP